MTRGARHCSWTVEKRKALVQPDSGFIALDEKSRSWTSTERAKSAYGLAPAAGQSKSEAD
ncbi:hypothetical protein F9802_04310 [Bacillus aerolatus]|uniref:Uncharacterized protein n=1 Tax=Bacillus aerolatus TaxID=2653354 RepID=A0A6I1FNA7_9BACI|nr:hypothetical protein [Bacillus aerolatus]KAB7707944.1 hypothetical protein F9802_04310 [Bacillus aerolatus]